MILVNSLPIVPVSPVFPTVQLNSVDYSRCNDPELGLYLSQRMELVWHGEFDRLFSQYYPHTWSLMPTSCPPGGKWLICKDSAKVRFSCQKCGHCWTSMKGRVIFWYYLNQPASAGYVLFKLYGQQCQNCQTGEYEHAMWYQEEVAKVVVNVYHRIGQVYYGFVMPPLRVDRRHGKPRDQHHKDLCQACREGFCREGMDVVVMEESGHS